ncbi:glycoside hydrolase family 36 protein [Mucilaginibacter xinganensis]|uniref:Alpha-galactosidase n=1 Tax=Mucilaginibacter xinganensis TaxID=1234841 RepID=A0A223NVY6_9SPHI|nr:glycoside hydrolase family 36 protein [Mucilaginibacter xinganensis]ASU33940.1 alpha-galactosidase [Mucilaginibacter xinganensis]
MKLTTCLLFFWILTGTSVNAQHFASWDNNELTLNNGIVKRVIKLPASTGRFVTTLYKPISGKFEFFDTVSTDFQFEVNDRVYSGSKTVWQLIGIKNCSDATSGSGAAVTLLSDDKKIELTVQYLLYPGSAAIRKNLTVKNLSHTTVKLESVDVEKLELNADGPTFSQVMHDYGRRRSLGPYDGNMQDALITVHNSQWEQGIVIGNEAAGVIKHTSFFWGGMDICSGFTHKDARYPFRKYILPGELFTTAQVFTMVYNNQKDAGYILNTEVADFVRKYLGSRLSLLKQKPTFVYNTWEPFGSNINEKLVMELARAAAKAGMKEFVIDDGWQDSYGDWGIDKKKFPRGLKPVFDYIKSLGMKPGLWISVGSATPDSKVFKAHPEWFVKDKNGKLTSLHLDADADRYTACFSTGWYGYIKGVLLKLATDYGLEYMKLDFAVVTSPYRYDPTASGCYATDHPGHSDHNESLYANYEQVWKLFDELHAAKPGLFIDCTFETMGGLQLIDYAMLKHAEGNWLSNFTGHAEQIDLSIRNMAWWRSPAIPATALVIGNPEMQDTGWDLHIKSLAGALPIMLGDPRKLTAADITKYRVFADWLQLMDRRYQIMSFRQDLPGFGEPMEGFWDGFQRINTQTKTGGIVGVFRQGSAEVKRMVTVFNLDPLKTYQVKKMDGTAVITQTGRYLNDKGFEVALDKKYDGELFEIAEKAVN